MEAVLITNCNFPFGSAWSSRAQGFVKLFCSCGYHVHIIAPYPQYPQDQEKDSLNSFDYSIDYVNYRDTILTLCGIGAAAPFCKALDSYLKAHNVAFVFSNRMPFASEYISSVAHTFGIPYILEQCEWFDSSSFKGGVFNPYFRRSERLIRKSSFKFAVGIVSISRLLEDHYASLPVIRIPTILDTAQIKYSLGENDKKICHLVFAGNITGRKELLTPIFLALSKVASCKYVFHFDIYGPTYKQILDNISGNVELWNTVSDAVTIYGRIPQQKIEEKLRSADYSIFIRPNRRSSNAGFPTKLAESMAVGTPVITNDTGDVGLYIDDSNGFLLPDGSSDSLLNIFLSILPKSDREKREMRLSARKRAETAFDFHNYVEPFKQFINSVLSTSVENNNNDDNE